jgi:hypothetical protein
MQNFKLNYLMFDKKTYENSKEAQNSHIATKKIKIWERISNIVGEEGGGGGEGYCLLEMTSQCCFLTSFLVLFNIGR